MALTNSSQNNSSLFSAFNKQYNINKQSSEDIQDLIRSLNIIDPDQLSKEEISIILKRIDDYSGLFTTQQLENIDFNNFNQHVFFDSAVNKISYSFDRIHNTPYDQDEITNIKYNNKTDGYTNFLLKNIFPKTLGFARFSGNEKLVIYDHQGKLLNDSETKNIGILNPKSSRFSFDFWLKINSSGFTQNQILFKKFDNTENSQNGFICYVTEGISEGNCYINFAMFINGKNTLSKCLIEKDLFQNIVISISSFNGNKKTTFIINGNIANDDILYNSDNILKDSSFGDEFSKVNLPFVIGGTFLIQNNGEVNSSMTVNIDNSDITFTNLKGDIDEFRFFHKVRSTDTIKKEMHKNIYAQKGLKLYLRLNEPGGNYQNSCLVIDYSGNKLHGLIYRFNIANNRNEIAQDTSEIKINTDTPLKLERKVNSPVLNSSYTDTIHIRSKLMRKAKDYDNNNPNLIFNLMPKHYFLNSSDLQNLPVYSNDNSYTLPSSIVNQDGTISSPTNLKPSIPANNELVNIVLIWARFFDKLKMYISSITNFLNVDYESINNKKIIGMQIPILCKMYGIKFKELLPSATKEKLNNENLNFEDIVSEYGIRKIQNILWQRFLINTQDFLKSKGTIRSIESSFCSFGIDYNKFIDIKEFSSFNDINKDNNYNLVNTKKYALNFGNKNELLISPTYSNESIDDYSQNKLYLSIDNIRTQTLKKFNETKSFINGLSLDWTIETFFNFKEEIEQSKISNQTYKNKQCILRLDTDGSPSLIATYEKNNGSNSDLGNITVNIQPIKNNPSYNISISLLNVNIFNMPKYFCISQQVDLNLNKITYKVLIDDIGKQNNIKNSIEKSFTTEEIVIRNNINQITSSLSDIAELSNNLSFYKNSLRLSIGNYNYTGNSLLSTSIISDEDTNFQGEIIKIRMWNKKLEEKEIISHSKNLDNIGTYDNDPQNYLISDFETKNIESILENGVRKWNINDVSNNVIKDESLNTYSNLNYCNAFTRNSLQNDDSIINFLNIILKVTNIKIDEPSRYNRVNIISYSNNDNKNQTNNFNEFPSNQIPIDFKYDDTTRVSIDMSIVKIINNDISNMIADLNLLTSNISNSQSIFEYNYKNLESIRGKYFEKYSDSKIINYSSIGNIFKYFDNIMSSILYDIVPSRVRFEGFNYVYESHVLERHKYEYKNQDSQTSLVNSDQFADYSRDVPLNRRNMNYNNNRRLR